MCRYRAASLNRHLKVLLQWRNNEHDGVSNHRRPDCLLNRLLRCRSTKTPKLRVTGLCEGNPPMTDAFLSQRSGNAKNVSVWKRHLVNDYPPISHHMLASWNRNILCIAGPLWGESIGHLWTPVAKGSNALNYIHRGIHRRMVGDLRPYVWRPCGIVMKFLFLSMVRESRPFNLKTSSNASINEISYLIPSFVSSKRLFD